ncbi:outer membrane protein assembly factor BamB family protein [Novosphingobium rosa]|uniref:outer membrane protein assembly factor BamB family protein n=1 Tax=Novosphingobium rosa TaxID=76978 RepID=UPI00082BE1CD|nr:PQQ-binding-like beta-propeller repeat protein [Novosphingobium rosa]
MTPSVSRRTPISLMRGALGLALAVSLAACGHAGKHDVSSVSDTDASKPVKKKKHGKRPTPTNGNRIPILSRIESANKVDNDIANMAVVVPTAEENADWSQPGGSANKASGNLALAKAPKEVWTAEVAGSNPRQRLAAAPVVSGGLLFMFDTGGILHAFDAKTGAGKWTASFDVAGMLGQAVFGGGASVDGGRVYVTTGLGDVAALDAATGKQVWKVKPAGPLRGSPTVAFGTVFVMTQNNEIHALNADDGSELWQEAASLGQTGVFGVGAPAAGQGSVVAGFSTGELVAYRYENGRQLWSDALSRTSLSTSVGVLTDIDAAPIIDRGRVFALGQGGRMASYDLLTGQRVWELNVAGISTPAISGDWIFTLTDDDRLLCIARSNGKVRWIAQLDRYHNAEKKAGAIFWTGPVLAGDQLWVANSEGALFTVSVMDGLAKRYMKFKTPISLAPVVAGSTLYVIEDSGKITALK